MGTNAHAANRSVKTIMTINTPDPNLYDEGDGRSAIDHWVLLDSVQQWPSLPFTSGGDLWSYTTCNTGFGNAPEWLVDYPPNKRAHPVRVLELDARGDGNSFTIAQTHGPPGTPSAVGTMWILQLAATASEDPATEYSCIRLVRSAQPSPRQGYVQGHP